MPDSQNSRLIDGIIGVILAGGQSRRMGSNKSLLELNGRRLIECVYDRLAPLFRTTLLVTNTPDDYLFLNCHKVPDIFVGAGSLAGIHAALTASQSDYIFVVGCDMPSLSQEVIRTICSRAAKHDVVVPCSSAGLEPLHALYSRRCLPVIEQMLSSGQQTIYTLFDRVNTLIIPWSELSMISGAPTTFLNLNTRQQYEELTKSTV